MHLIEREWVGVFIVDEGAVFAVFQQIADVYDQAHGSDRWFWINKMLIPDLMAIADLKEQSDSIFLNLIQNFSSYILSDPDTN